MQILIYIATIIGLLDSGYLSFGKITETSLYCTPGFGDCASVNASQWSYLFGIPVAYLGFLTYVAILLLAIFGKKIKFIAPYTEYLFFFITLVGLLFSGYLTYIEAAVLHTFCQWCLLSAAMITILFIISVIKLARRQQ
ncbi:MAG: vitamin K epoxide reductase family protein [Anaerolineaceae bacterium]